MSDVGVAPATGTLPDPAGSLGQAWDRLHAQARFRPAYPSEPVVRFIARRFGNPAPPRQAATILDLGCGAGRHLALIAAAGHRAIGVDLSREGLRHTARLLAGRGQQADLAQATMQALPFQAEQFDGAIAYGVLNYATAAGFQAAAHELWRVLRPGGRLLAVTRTTRDYRFGKGRRIEPHTFVLEIDETNEAGMVMHFLDRAAIDASFARFARYTVDWIDHTSGGGTVLNSDWVIEACK